VAREPNWESIARAAVHPLTLRIIERAVAAPGERFAPAELAAEWGQPLGNVAYHVRKLHEDGLLVRAGSQTVRGAVKHFYRAGERLLAV
jgi:DNA-binding GntR family transcriptional regulator